MDIEMFKDAYDKISINDCWDILAEYLNVIKACQERKSDPSEVEEAYLRSVEAGEFMLSLQRGELHWQFSQASYADAMKGVGNRFLKLTWEIPTDNGKNILKTICIFRGDFIDSLHALRKEMGESMFLQFSLDLCAD